MLQTADQDLETVRRERCYDCFRPKADCFCAAIPAIANRTEVLIVQHVRERFHPFNTARIVRRSLANSSLLVDQTDCLAERLVLKPDAGLLFPGPGATLVSDVPPSQRPAQLVVLDGTWSHAKSLVRDIPALRGLPRYRLAPASPSRYRIRREPSAVALSTVEAVVAVLRAWEPDTRGLDQLLAAFDCMVERQLIHPKAERAWRRHAPRSRTFRNIPLSLLGDLSDVVVAYGESIPREFRRHRAPRQPAYWAAQRLGTGERFACAIRCDAPLPASVLERFELTDAEFSRGPALEEARATWAAFQRPSDIMAVYHQSTAGLLAQMSLNAAPCLVLKAVDFNRQRRYATLDELAVGERLEVDPPRHPGRAGKRLAMAVALVHRLNAIGASAIGEACEPERRT